MPSASGTGAQQRTLCCTETRQNQSASCKTTTRGPRSSPWECEASCQVLRRSFPWSPSCTTSGLLGRGTPSSWWMGTRSPASSTSPSRWPRPSGNPSSADTSHQPKQKRKAGGAADGRGPSSCDFPKCLIVAPPPSARPLVFRGTLSKVLSQFTPHLTLDHAQLSSAGRWAQPERFMFSAEPELASAGREPLTILQQYIWSHRGSYHPLHRGNTFFTAKGPFRRRILGFTSCGLQPQAYSCAFAALTNFHTGINGEGSRCSGPFLVNTCK